MDSRSPLYGSLAIAGWNILGLTAIVYGGVREPLIILGWIVIGLSLCIFVIRRGS